MFSILCMLHSKPKCVCVCVSVRQGCRYTAWTLPEYGDSSQPLPHSIHHEPRQHCGPERCCSLEIPNCLGFGRQGTPMGGREGYGACICRLNIYIHTRKRRMLVACNLNESWLFTVVDTIYKPFMKLNWGIYWLWVVMVVDVCPAETIFFIIHPSSASQLLNVHWQVLL